jgi:glutaredoxin 3
MASGYLGPAHGSTASEKGQRVRPLVRYAIGVRAAPDHGNLAALMALAEVVVYSTDYCPYCTAAKALLSKKNVVFDEVNVEERPELRAWLARASGQRTVPQIFINNEPVGGFTDMAALERRGELDRLLAEPRPAGLPALPR